MDIPSIIVSLVVGGISGLVGATIGSYYGSYNKRKGEIFAEYEDFATIIAQESRKAYEQEAAKRLATHEDIENVLAEVRKVTTEQESIKAQISGDAWLKQTVWVEKRKAYAALLKSLTAMHHAFRDLTGSLGIRESRSESAPDYAAVGVDAARKRGACLDAMFDVILSFGEAALFDERVYDQMLRLLGSDELTLATNVGATSLETSRYAGILSGFRRDIIAHMRRELGVPEQPPSVFP